MAVSPANDTNIDAWQDELNLGLNALEYLEEALRLTRKMSSGQSASETIQQAIDYTERLASKSALKVGRLRREKESA